MRFTVEHRPDKLLQKSTDQPVAPDLMNTFIGKVTQPHHEMALKFLNEKIIGRKFKNAQALQVVLNTWPKFAQERGLQVHREFNEINMDIENNYIAFPPGMGEPFVIGLITALTSE